REEAKQVYETAKNQGQAAALLDQERANIFTQAVANILPNEKVTIEITFVETLKYENGSYEFVFPTVVGPRYNPSQVVDAKAITPTLAPTDVRAGHDISITVNLDAGVPVENVAAKSHEIETTNMGANRAVVKLKDLNEIPNRDFVLRYDVTGKRIEDAILLHRDERGGYFSLILSPPEKIENNNVTPKEIVFVLDTSGSMSGFPIDKAKESMKLAMENLRPFDTFNLITFAGDTSVLFDKPVSATVENLEKAQAFLESREGGGGTEMMKAIKVALAPSDNQNAVRIVCFMTDGYIGNEGEIIAEVQKHPNARVFGFGIGSSVNRFLLDKMSEEGRGEVEYVDLNDDGSAAAKRFHERVQNPILTDISIDYNGLPMTDVYPKRIPDLFGAKPVIVNGRFTKAGSGTIKLKGKIAGQDFTREIKVDLPESEPKNDVLATLWARTRIDDLMSQDYQGAQINAMTPALQNTITSLGLEYNLLTQFTSFVAVEEKTVNQNGKPVRVDVPVEVPDGVKREMIANDFPKETGSLAQLPIQGRNISSLKMTPSPKPLPSKSLDKSVKERGKQQLSMNGGISGIGATTTTTQITRTNNSPSVAKVTGPISGGVVNGKAKNLVTPSYPLQAKTVRASGQVSVQVLIDESGKVIYATAVSGNSLLRASAAQAARASTFSPTMLSGQPVKTSGTIIYNFTPDGSSTQTLLANTQTPNAETSTAASKIVCAISGGVVMGKAIRLPMPPIPSGGVYNKDTFTPIPVRVLVNEDGNVVSATAVSGHPLLKASAAQAARASKFYPSLLDGIPTKVVGTITYDFVTKDESKKIVFSLMPESQEKLKLFKSKLNPQIFALVERLQKANSIANVDESKFVRDGKAEIIVQITANNAETLSELKNLGFEFDNQTSNFIVGRIALEKLTALAESNSVKFIAQQN
ncbi:MAG: TonB family protein, partial [Pyrinomonadaceae bacterium]|nr:TonB family protein [Pyrinomonadaceae bacterium]